MPNPNLDWAIEASSEMRTFTRQWTDAMLNGLFSEAGTITIKMREQCRKMEQIAKEANGSKTM